MVFLKKVKKIASQKKKIASLNGPEAPLLGTESEDLKMGT